MTYKCVARVAVTSHSTQTPSLGPRREAWDAGLVRVRAATRWARGRGGEQISASTKTNELLQGPRTSTGLPDAEASAGEDATESRTSRCGGGIVLERDLPRFSPRKTGSFCAVPGHL